MCILRVLAYIDVCMYVFAFFVYRYMFAFVFKCVSAFVCVQVWARPGVCVRPRVCAGEYRRVRAYKHTMAFCLV